MSNNNVDNNKFGTRCLKKPKMSVKSIWAVQSTLNAGDVPMNIICFLTKQECIKFVESYGFQVKNENDLCFVETNCLDIVEKGLFKGYTVRSGYEIFLEIVEIPINRQLVEYHNE